MELLKYFAVAWLGACIRNENDRRRTIELFDSLGAEAEKAIKGLFLGGGANHAQPVQNDQPSSDEQEFV